MFQILYSFSGVSECIIMGIPMSIGTGVFKLLYKYPFTLQITCSLNFQKKKKWPPCLSLVSILLFSLTNSTAQHPPVPVRRPLIFDCPDLHTPESNL